MIVTFKLNVAQAMALVECLHKYEGDQYLDYRYWEYPLKLTNSAGNKLELYGNILAYSGSRNAPWAGRGNAISDCFRAAGIIHESWEVADEFRHIAPLCSEKPEQEWWRHSYKQYWDDKTVSNFTLESTDPEPLPYDDWVVS